MKRANSLHAGIALEVLKHHFSDDKAWGAALRSGDSCAAQRQAASGRFDGVLRFARGSLTDGAELFSPHPGAAVWPPYRLGSAVCLRGRAVVSEHARKGQGSVRVRKQAERALPLAYSCSMFCQPRCTAFSTPASSATSVFVSCRARAGKRSTRTLAVSEHALSAKGDRVDVPRPAGRSSIVWGHFSEYCKAFHSMKGERRKSVSVVSVFFLRRGPCDAAVCRALCTDFLHAKVPACKALLQATRAGSQHLSHRPTPA